MVKFTHASPHGRKSHNAHNIWKIHYIAVKIKQTSIISENRLKKTHKA